MKNFGNVVFVFFLVLLFPSYALAYIDPINGSILLQMLLSGVAGAFFVFRHLLYRIWCKILGKNQSDIKK